MFIIQKVYHDVCYREPFLVSMLAISKQSVELNAVLAWPDLAAHPSVDLI